MELKTLDSITTEEKTDPSGYDKLCHEIVATGGNNMHKDDIARFLKFKNDKVVQELGFTEQEIQNHLKATYLEVIRDLKMPFAFAAKKIAELEVKREKQALLNRSRGENEELTEFDLKVISSTNELLKTLDKLGFKEKKEVHVHHHFHDEVDNVLDANWKEVHHDEENR